MIRKFWLYGLAMLLVAIGVGALIAVYQSAEARYRELHRVRLDPTSERHFAPRNAALPPPVADVPRIVFFGDSRIADWPALPSVPGAEIVERGRGGETTQQLLLRLDRDVLALSPDVVVLQAGVNDLVALGVFPERAGAIIETCRLNLERIIARLRAAEIRVVVLTILPAGSVPLQRRPVWSDQTYDAIAQINDRLRSIDATDPGVVVVDCDAVVAEGRLMKPEFELDTLHLNARGYSALTALLEPVLANVVQGGGSPG